MKAHLNPFAPDHIQRQLPFDLALVDITWQALEQKWARLNYRAAVVGPHGSGKSTFLKTLAQRLRDDHHVVTLFFRVGDTSLTQSDWEAVKKCDTTTILLVDGEGHLTLHERHRLRKAAKQAGRYLAARHRPSTLPTLLHLRANANLASQLLARLELPEQDELQKRLPLLLAKKNGNLREVWLSLYDEYALKD